MRVLLIDAAGTGRFNGLARALAEAGNESILLRGAGPGATAGRGGPRGLAGVRCEPLPAAQPAEPELMPHLHHAQVAVRQGQEVVHVLHGLGPRARPDLVVAAAVEGTSLFVREVAPRARVLVWSDLLHGRPEVEDLNGDAFADHAVRRARSTVPLLAMVEADWVAVATVQEARSVPTVLASRLSILPLGVDRSTWHRPPGWALPADPAEEAAWVGELLLAGRRVVTVSCAGPGRHAGLPEVIEAAERVLARHADVAVVLLTHPASGVWPAPEVLLRRLDPARFGLVPIDDAGEARRALWASVAHVAVAPSQALWDTPLAALAAGVPLVGGGPCFGHLLAPGRTGFPLRPDPGSLAGAVDWVVDHPTEAAAAATGGTTLVARSFDSATTLRAAISLCTWVASGGPPPRRVAPAR